MMILHPFPKMGGVWCVAWRLEHAFPLLCWFTQVHAARHTLHYACPRPIATRQYFYAGYKGFKKLGIQKNKRKGEIGVEIDV